MAPRWPLREELRSGCHVLHRLAVTGSLVGLGRQEQRFVEVGRGGGTGFPSV